MCACVHAICRVQTLCRLGVLRKTYEFHIFVKASIDESCIFIRPFALQGALIRISDTCFAILHLPQGVHSSVKGIRALALALPCGGAVILIGGGVCLSRRRGTVAAETIGARPPDYQDISIGHRANGRIPPVGRAKKMLRSSTAARRWHHSGAQKGSFISFEVHTAWNT